MAKQVLGPLTQITINGTDLSDHISNIELEDSADEVEVTGFGEVYKEYEVGLKDAQITCTVFQDFASGKTDAVIGGMYYANTAGTIKVKPDTGGTVVYTLIGKPYSWSPVSGGVGDANEVEVVFRNAGTAGLTRGTT